MEPPAGFQDGTVTVVAHRGGPGPSDEPAPPEGPPGEHGDRGLLIKEPGHAYLLGRDGTLIRAKSIKKKEDFIPRTSGVRPRGCLLPVTTILVMIVPVLALCLPVFLAVRRGRIREDNAVTTMCALATLNQEFLDFANRTEIISNVTAENIRVCPWALLQADDKSVPWNSVAIEEPFRFPINVPAEAELIQAEYVMMTMSVVSIDHQRKTCDVSATISFGGALEDSLGGLILGPDYDSLVVSFYAPNTADKVFVAGERRSQQTVTVTVNEDASLFSYPFDKYRVEVSTTVQKVRGKFVRKAVPTIIKFKTGLAGYLIKVNPGEMFLSEHPQREDFSYTSITFEVEIRRAPVVALFSVMLLIGMWLIVAFSITYALDTLYLRPRRVGLEDAGLFTALLFALPGIRDTMPGVPDVGVGIDFLGFIWLMLFMMVITGQVLSKQVGQHVHYSATLYDKVFKTEAYRHWHENKHLGKTHRLAEAGELEALGFSQVYMPD